MTVIKIKCCHRFTFADVSTHLVSYFENTNDREFFLHVSCFSEGDVSAEEKNAEHFLDKVRFSTSSRKHLSSQLHTSQLQVPSRYNVTPQVHLEQLFQRQRAHQQEQQGRDSRAQRKVKYLKFSLSTATVLFPLPRNKLLLLRPPAATYPSAASSGRRNSISVSANSNLASMSNNTSSSMVATSSSTTRRRHVSMSSAASYGTPAASRGLPFYWT